MKIDAGVWAAIIGGLAAISLTSLSLFMPILYIGIYIGFAVLILLCAMFFLFYHLFFKQIILTSRLRRTGIPTKAVITAIVNTNIAINYQSQIKLVLEVKNSLGEPYSGKVLALVSRLQPTIYSVGMTVQVLVDPTNKNKMILDGNYHAAQSRATHIS